MHTLDRGDTTSPSRENLDIFGARLTVLSDGQTMPMVVCEKIVPPGYGLPLHIHEADSELSYILEGQLLVTSPQGERIAGPGACIEVPHGTAHGFRNVSERPVRLMLVMSPGVLTLAMFRHYDRACRKGELTAAQVLEIAGLYGVSPA